jgi:hypothetical protein
LLLKKTGNVERSTWLQNHINRIQGKSNEGAQINILVGLLEAGEKKAEQDISFNEFCFNVNEHITYQKMLCEKRGRTSSFKKQ